MKTKIMGKKYKYISLFLPKHMRITNKSMEEWMQYAIPCHDGLEYADKPVFVKHGKFGFYVEYETEGGEKKTLSIPDKNIPGPAIMDMIREKECPPLIKQEENDDEYTNKTKNIRWLTDSLSVREGKYGKYLFFQRPQREGRQTYEKPTFYSLRDFQGNMENSGELMAFFESQQQQTSSTSKNSSKKSYKRYSKTKKTV